MMRFLNVQPPVANACPFRFVLCLFLLGACLTCGHASASPPGLRFQYSVSDGDNGLLLQQHYEQEVVPDGRGNACFAFYAGLNYLIYGNRFKLMTGAE